MLQGNENPFFDTCIDYEAGDQFYLFSDGLPDQFGGPNNKKFLRKQLLKILDENHFKKPHEVVAMLEKRFFEWNGTYRQIDDVLVLGFEV